MDDFAIDEKSGVPVWVQLRNRLLYLITSGHYRVGDQLPTVHKMAVLLKINYNTVNKVYQGLERDGLIVSKRGQGTFVTEPTDQGTGRPTSTVDLITDEYLARMRDLGLVAADIELMVKSRLEKEGKR
ncbi:MAG: GntR family transcriptional regulator [Coriobacteriaceae bacterium]|jgi:GntR family transcriptional regulator|nr:GntR family transcriptional regulator [Coriobacteriaceae bacterium]